MREGYYKPRPLPRKPIRKPLPSRVNVSKEPPKTNHHNKKKKSPNILIIGLIALVLLIAIIILLVKIFGGDSGSNNNIYNVEDLEMKVSNAFVDGDSLNVVVDVISDDGSLESIKFIMEGYGKQEIFLEDYTSNSISENQFLFNLEDMKLEEVTKISIIPVIKDKKGNLITGNVKDIYGFSYKPEDNDNDDDDDVPYDSYWNSSSNNNSSGNCTPKHDYECHNGSVYWFDSCDKLGELKDTCDSGEVCFLGTCVTSGNTPGPTNPECGNNVIDSGEYCDGYNIAGETCAGFGFNLGILKCNSYCTFDISGCYNDGGSDPNPNPDPKCVLTPYYSCHNGDVWFYDSCGAPIQVKDYCSSGEDCVTNECKTQGTNYPPPPLPPPIPT